MASISDEIESYLRQLLVQSGDGTIVIQRTELADLFDCVPSQITYVLMTRFTPDRGYLVEGRRGGGGNIRVAKLSLDERQLMSMVDGLEGIDQARALGIVIRALEAGYVSEREAMVMQSALKRDVIQVPLPDRDRIRARLLRAMFAAVLGSKGVY